MSVRTSLFINSRMIQHKCAIFFLLTVWLTFFPSCGNTSPTYRVLVIQSYENDYPGYKNSEQFILEKFNKEGIQTSLKTFYLNCEQYPPAIEERVMYRFLDNIIKWKPDLILVYDDQAAYTLMACKHPFASSIPVVFGGVSFPNLPLLSQYTNVSGFWDKPYYAENIRMIEHCLGKATVYMLHDSTFIDKCIKNELYKQCDSAGILVTHNRAMYKVHYETTFEEVMKYMEKPDTTTVNIVPVQGDKLAAVSWYMSKYAPHIFYLQAKRDYRVMNTSRFSSKPSFTVINEDLGYDSKLVGGYLTSQETQYNETVHQAAEILQGKPVQSFPQITESAKEYVFDYKEVEYWGIDKNLLPPNVVYLNRPFINTHPVVAWGLIFLSIGSVVILFGKIILLYRKEAKAKRKAQTALLQEKESLADALEKANESDHMKSVFLANMSHEIRTPLNAIVGFSSLLTELELSEEEKKQYAEIITTNNDLLLKLINDILDLARLESGHISLQMISCDLTQLVKELYNSYLPNIPDSISYRIKCPETPVCLTTDRDRLYQVLENILNNAIKFTSKGFIEIGYEYLADKQEVCLYVQDSGIGISQEEQDIIFERFKKLDDFIQGTGLGLSICHAITQRLDGRISILSEKDKGSRFTLSFNL